LNALRHKSGFVRVCKRFAVLPNHLKVILLLLLFVAEDCIEWLYSSNTPLRCIIHCFELLTFQTSCFGINHRFPRISDFLSGTSAECVVLEKLFLVFVVTKSKLFILSQATRQAVSARRITRSFILQCCDHCGLHISRNISWSKDLRYFILVSHVAYETLSVPGLQIHSNYKYIQVTETIEFV